MSTRKAIIVDLEGTYADTKHRLHHLTGARPNWDAFFSEIDTDTVVPHVARLVNLYAAAGYRVLFLTMRPDIFRHQTMVWLDRVDAPVHRLLMRPTGWAHEADAEFKLHVFNQEIKPMYDVELVLEDRPEVVEMWNTEACVPCLAVNQEPWVAQFKKQCRAQALSDAVKKLSDYYSFETDESMAVKIVRDLYDETMEEVVWCVFCKKEHAGGATCMGHHP